MAVHAWLTSPRPRPSQLCAFFRTRLEYPLGPAPMGENYFNGREPAAHRGMSNNTASQKKALVGPQKPSASNKGAAPKKRETNFGDWLKYGPETFEKSEWAVVSTLVLA
jgi:hypothetical protein